MSEGNKHGGQLIGKTEKSPQRANKAPNELKSIEYREGQNVNGYTMAFFGGRWCALKASTNGVARYSTDGALIPDQPEVLKGSAKSLLARLKKCFQTLDGDEVLDILAQDVKQVNTFYPLYNAEKRYNTPTRYIAFIYYLWRDRSYYPFSLDAKTEDLFWIITHKYQ
jgi:hypothetical protein